ncbi:ABC transporter substrate-binding protein [Loktanella sp. Alg231-35]|uniref:ABC transporter substrate-binding protein n=1 Tax=Loktanella sp. Alg231-35 TaxID=1922220 RepID=UPI000D556895|nr:ABC transporter substrate-binding protein [Loktanella sp. Alg231-35]
MQRLKYLLMILLTGPAASAAWADETLTIVSWGGVYEQAQRQAIFDPFSKATGITIENVTYSGGVDAVRNGAAQGDWDVIDMIEDQAITACDAGLLSQISFDQVAVAHQSIPVEDDFLLGAFRNCSIAQNVYSTVFAYNDRAFLGEKPESIADFFDLEKFPGTRALLRDPDVILEWALMAEGVPIDQVYDLLSTERGMRLAFRRLETLRGSIIWWETVDTPAEMLNDERAVMASGYNGRFFSAAQDDGMPITIVWDGQVISYETWSILRSSQKQELARQFVRFATAPEQLAALAELIPYGPTRTSAISRVGLHETTGVPMRDHLPNAPQYVDRALYGDSLWYARTKDFRRRRFEAWLREG